MKTKTSMRKLILQNTVKPFVKWAGGKGQLLSQLDRCLPVGLENREFTYVEPFVGGGAMLFHMLQKFPKIGKVVINDINSNNISYQIIYGFIRANKAKNIRDTWS